METNLQKSTWMKKKYLAYGIIPAFALALAGAGVASAHGFGFGMSNLTPQQIAQNQTDRFVRIARRRDRPASTAGRHAANMG
jgi:hypothetical protein